MKVRYRRAENRAQVCRKQRQLSKAAQEHIVEPHIRGHHEFPGERGTSQVDRRRKHMVTVATNAT